MEVKASIPGPACALENYLIPTQERVWPACARPLRPGKDQGPLRMACFCNGLLLQRSRKDGKDQGPLISGVLSFSWTLQFLFHTSWWGIISIIMAGQDLACMSRSLRPAKYSGPLKSGVLLFLMYSLISLPYIIVGNNLLNLGV